MVQLMNSGTFRSDSDASCRGDLPVKLEIEDTLEDEYGPFYKRSKNSSSFSQQWSTESSSLSNSAAQYNPLDEPSPLGLQLKKTPSFMDLIAMRLSQGNGFTIAASQADVKKEVKGASSAASDKLKASNFPASLLRIGTWEAISRYEGDLVAKCYYAKHKLVWEVLDGGLKSKMEIQWSDITALKANFPEDGPGTLDIVLARQPIFFRETNPQPRKHTLWQATSDFTGGQASIHRRHFLQCPQGLLNKNFEKLIQCDPRLNWLSHQPEVVLESPFFEPKGSIFEDPDDVKSPERSDYSCTFSGFGDGTSPSPVQASPSKSELQNSIGRSPDLMSRDTQSPSSVMDLCAIEDTRSRETEQSNRFGNLNQLKVPGLHSSMSMSDLVNHIGHCISEQKSSGNPLFSDGQQNDNMLEELAQYLLSDSQHAPTSDEKSLMSRVDSLCCLLQKDTAGASEAGLDKTFENKVSLNPDSMTKITSESSDERVNLNTPGEEQEPSMKRNDSISDFLLHLPRIASLPQFLFNIPEDNDYTR